MNITPEDAKNILIIIARSDIKGSEVDAVFDLRKKLIKIAKPLIKNVKEGDNGEDRRRKEKKV